MVGFLMLLKNIFIFKKNIILMLLANHFIQANGLNIGNN